MSESSPLYCMGLESSRGRKKRGRTPEVEAEPKHPAELGAGRDVREKSGEGSTELSVIGIWRADKAGGKGRIGRKAQ